MNIYWEPGPTEARVLWRIKHGVQRFHRDRFETAVLIAHKYIKVGVGQTLAITKKGRRALSGAERTIVRGCDAYY